MALVSEVSPLSKLYSITMNHPVHSHVDHGHTTYPRGQEIRFYNKKHYRICQSKYAVKTWFIYNKPYLTVSSVVTWPHGTKQCDAGPLSI